MSFELKTVSTIEDLKAFIKTHSPAFYFASKTSTVIPYDNLERLLPWDKKETFTLVDLSKLKGHLSLTKENHLKISGAISWEEAQAFCISHDRAIMTSPTEQLALVTAGVATSCTGERCFGFGTLRDQIVSLSYIDFNGDLKTLHAANPFENLKGIVQYQNEYKAYASFKNAPFPRFNQATDLLVGTEGQVGIVTEVVLKTAPSESITYMFLLLPKWEEDTRAHLEILNLVQDLRSSMYSCEILDSHCMNCLKTEDRLGVNQDVIFLEIKTSDLDLVYKKLISQLKLTPESNVFEISKQKFHYIRSAVPRAIFEKNTQMKVVKMGTDVQVKTSCTSELFNFYKSATNIGVDYCLFGHFGDSHLHFNYLPKPDQMEKCSKRFSELYKKVSDWKGSPFAEHGVGLLKLDYIKHFYHDSQFQVFSEIKKSHDPYNQFFPQGFMSAKP